MIQILKLIQQLNISHYIACVLVLALMSVSTITFADSESMHSCTVPTKIEPWDYYATKHIRSGKDWKNTTIKTDYWQLVYSWSPSYCKARGEKAQHIHQCRKDFGLIIHGLWAQSVNAKDIKHHPRNCRDVAALNKSILRNNFCLMPSVALMQKQWEKHGTCGFRHPEDYFARIQALHRQITLPNKRTLTFFQTQRPLVIEDWLVRHNKAIDLRREHIKINKKGRVISDIIFCYDLNFKLRACRSKVKTGVVHEFSAENKERSTTKASEDKSWLDQFFYWLQQ